MTDNSTAGYDALMNSAGLLDLSSRGRIRVTGEDRSRLLHAMSFDQAKPQLAALNFAQVDPALWEAARETGFKVPLSVRWHSGTTVNVTLGNDNSLCLYVCGSFEPNEFAFLDRALTPGMTFVDVGANDGYYTLFAARKVGPGGRVIAIEPSSRERAHLRRNLERNSIANVSVVPISGPQGQSITCNGNTGNDCLSPYLDPGAVAQGKVQPRSDRQAELRQPDGHEPPEGPLARRGARYISRPSVSSAGAGAY